MDARARSRWILTAFLAASPLFLLAASSDPITLIFERERREVTPVVRGSAELVPLDPLVSALGLSYRSDPAGGSVTLGFEGRQVVLYDKKTLASVGGDLRLLSAPVAFENGHWLVPVDSAPRIFGPLLNRRAEWRVASRALLLGNVRVPTVTVRTGVSGDLVRVSLEASERLGFNLEREPGRVRVSIPAGVVDVRYQQERLTGGIVDLVQFQGGRDNVFVITLGPRFRELQSAEQESRLVLDFQAAPLSAGGPPLAPGASPGPGPSAPAPAAGPSIRTVVIDPGHGGTDVGAQGPTGTLEKEVALAIARKLKASLANTLGLEAFLTRDRDQEVALDERTAFANNYKADLFLSIHANASRARGARGSEVYFLSYQATDDESRRLALLEGEAAGLASPVPGSSDLGLILWDMAQAEHLEESSSLATWLQDELSEVTGSQGRGIKQAPFRVLVGAAMPAVLVEVAFISHPEEEKLLTSEDYQNRVVAALIRGIARYERERRVAAAPLPERRPAY